MSLSAAGVFTTPVFSTKVILPSSDSHQQPTVNSTTNEWSPTPFSIWVPCHCSMVCGRGQSESGYGHNRCPFFFFFLHGVLPHWLSLRRSLFFTFTRQSSLNDGHFSTCHHYRVVIIYFFTHGVWPRNLRFSPRRYISFTTNGTPITYFPTHSWLE